MAFESPAVTETLRVTFNSAYLPHISPLSGPGGSGKCSLDRRAGLHRWHQVRRPLGGTGAGEQDTEVTWDGGMWMPKSCPLWRAIRARLA